jgi:hypothetical protein
MPDARIEWNTAGRDILQGALAARGSSGSQSRHRRFRMKRIALFGVCLLLASSGAFAQSMDIDTPLLAAPANLREGATVIKWKPDHTYDTLRKGTNKLVCYDRSGFPLQRPFSVECTSLANLDRVAQNLKAEATGDKAKSEAMLKEEEQNGTRVKPEFGSMWYHFQGNDKEHARMHVTVAVPGATSASMGLPDNGRQGGLWIMDAGTSTAHLMIPGM